MGRCEIDPIDVLTLRAYVEAIFRGDYDLAGVERPTMLPSDHRRLAFAANDQHGIAAPLERVLAAEGFRLLHARAPRCGACLGNVLLVPWVLDAPTRTLLTQHERAHGWLQRRWPEATESDAWFSTAAFVRSSAEQVPAWFRAAVAASMKVA